MTMSDTNDPRSLDLCAIGLGQGGGNLAAEWRRRGYRAVVFNTARADLRGLSRAEDLEVPEENQHYIGIEGSDGAGRDPAFGRLCVREHADKIREIVSESLAGADALLLCAGLGGGTGSSCDAMIEVLAPLEIPILAVTTLPADNESGITKVNAVKSANGIVEADLAGRLFLDNERLQERFPDIDVVNYYPTINAKVLGPLDEINRLNGQSDLWSIRSFDGEDLRKVLLSGGVLQQAIEKIPTDEALTSERLVNIVQSCVDGGKHGATGLSLADCAYVALVIVGPEALLKETPARVVEDAIGQIKEKSGGAAVYEGMYLGPEDTKLKAYVVTASLALPSRVQALLGQARDEGGNLAKKIQKDIQKLELSPLDGLDLFRAPSRKSQGPRAPSPAPRPLSTPLLSEADQAPVGDIADGDDVDDDYDHSLQQMSDFDRPALGHENAPSLEQTAALEAKDDDEAKASAPTKRRDAPGPDEAPPRVGTGRYDESDDANLEPTAMVDADQIAEAKAAIDPERGFDVDDHEPRVGTGAWRRGEPMASIEATHLVEAKVERPKERPPMVDIPQVDADGDAIPESYDDDDGDVTEKRNTSDVFGEGPEKKPRKKKRHFNAEGDHGEYEINPDAPGFELAAVATHAIDEFDIIGEVPDRIRGGAIEATTADARLHDDDELVSSVLDPSSPGLQGVYEDLIERFRQAADKRGRDRVARRLIDDARSDDVEVRALAVWAMVKLEESGFRRALRKARKDENPEIQKLAESGLSRLPDRTRP